MFIFNFLDDNNLIPTDVTVGIKDSCFELDDEGDIQYKNLILNTFPNTFELDDEGDIQPVVYDNIIFHDKNTRLAYTITSFDNVNTNATYQMQGLPPGTMYMPSLYRFVGFPNTAGTYIATISAIYQQDIVEKKIAFLIRENVIQGHHILESWG